MVKKVLQVFTEEPTSSQLTTIIAATELLYIWILAMAKQIPGWAFWLNILLVFIAFFASHVRISVRRVRAP